MQLKAKFIIGLVVTWLAFPVHSMVVNGSFESGIAINTSTGARTVSGGDISGWIATGGRTVDYMVDGAFGPAYSPTFGSGLASQDGNRFVDLTGSDNGLGSISQTIDTAAGKTYRLSFYIGGTDLFGFGGDGGSPSVIASLNGVFSQSFTGSGNSDTDWQQQSLKFAGTGGSAVLSFAGAGTPGECCFIGLDNVEITALPEPGSLGLVLVGLIGMVLARRRKTA